MIRPIITLRRRRVIIDVDTQKDFFLAQGTHCIRNHRRILANLRRVIAWARLKNIRMISTARICDQKEPNCGYCIDGTDGQKKLSYTLRHSHTSFAADGCTDLPRDILKEYDQVILHKRTEDPFAEPRADRMLSELLADEFILVGAVTEEAVKATGLGLLARRKNVTVLVDAVGSRNKNAAQVALRQMEAKGAKLSDTKALCGSSHLRIVHGCNCDRCRGRLQKAATRTGT